MTLRNPYWLSALGHTALLSALLLLSSLARPQLFVGGVSIVMPPPGSGPGAGQRSAPAPREEPEESPELEPPPEPPVVEEPERRPQPERNVVKEPDPEGLLPKPEDDVPSERPDQRDPEPRPEPPVPPTPESTNPEGPDDARGLGERGQGGGSTSGSGSGIGIEGGVLGAHAPWYLVQLHDKIAANWRPPPVIGRSGRAEAKFQFVLNADGSVTNVQEVSSSGVRNYDMSGMRAIYNASPLPPIPEDLGEMSLGITLTFGKDY